MSQERPSPFRLQVGTRTALLADDLEVDGGESQVLEFKSGRGGLSGLKPKIREAASAFWNSGGGVLLLGVDNDGVPDGGIPTAHGRQPIEDWIDRVLSQLQPVGPYHLKKVDFGPGASLGDDRCVMAIEFAPSNLAPHMDGSGCYRVRLGRHTDVAPAYFVEALWAKRSVLEPRLSHALRLKADDPEVIQLVVVSLTDAPALDVQLTLDPVPAVWGAETTPFPLRVPFIDKSHPFEMDLTTFAMAEERLGRGVQLNAEFTSLVGRTDRYSVAVDLAAISPHRLGGGQLRKIAQHLEELAKHQKPLKDLVEAVERLHTIAGSTGLRLSRDSLADLKAEPGKPLQLLNPTECHWRAFVEVVGVSESIALQKIVEETHQRSRRLERAQTELRKTMGRNLDDFEDATHRLHILEGLYQGLKGATGKGYRKIFHRVTSNTTRVDQLDDEAAAQGKQLHHLSDRLIPLESQLAHLREALAQKDPFIDKMEGRLAELEILVPRVDQRVEGLEIEADRRVTDIIGEVTALTQTTRALEQRLTQTAEAGRSHTDELEVLKQSISRIGEIDQERDRALEWNKAGLARAMGTLEEQGATLQQLIEEDRARGFRITDSGITLVTPDMLGQQLHFTR